MARILVATRDGVYPLDDAGQPGEIHHPGRSVTALAPASSDVWAVVDATEIWHAAGPQWRHVADLDRPRATCLASIDGNVFVGSAEARLFRVRDTTLDPVTSFDDVEGRAGWYTPWGGPPDTRSMTNWDDDIYVNVHVGGIVHSPDGGDTWAPTIDIDADVHQVTTSEGLVLAACAGGLAASTDRGATWSLRIDGLEATYSRAVAVCGETLLTSTSNGPGGGGAAVYRAGLAGGAFERCIAGPGWFDDNIDSYCLDALPDGSVVAFATSDGRVYASSDEGSTWEERATGLPPVQRVLVMP